jgi:L-alanine-DL-glutamate epimerase-like enolase superfamily enzyme
MSVPDPIRIRSVEAIPVRVARRAELLPRTSHGEVAHSDYVLLRLLTEDGVVGLGEVTCEPRWNGEEWAGTTSLVRGRLNDLLTGADLRSWAALGARLDRAVRGRPFLRAGLEMACLDALGRTTGTSVTTLLGGALREQIPTRIVLPARDVDVVASMAATAIQRGAGHVKVKVGLDVAGDLARVRAVRDVVGPHTGITVDANEGWTAADAGAALRGLEALDVLGVEQPLARDAWRQMADLRTRTSVPTVGDESIWTTHDVLRAGQTGAFDIVSLYPGKCGGMGRSVQLAGLAASIGLTVSFGSNLELGVGAAAIAHAAAAAPALSDRVPSDLIGPLYFEHALVTDSSFVGWDVGRLPVGAGLGVDLDADAVESHRLERAA